MKITILYRPASEHERAVTNFQRDFTHRTGHEIDMVSLDTVDGDHMAKIYDITVYPAILATDDQGRVQKTWQGDQLPLINEVSFYTSTMGTGAI